MSEKARSGGRKFDCQRTAKSISLDEPACVDPKAYCKWRTACPVHILEKEAARARK